MGSSPLDRKIKGTLIADLFHLVGFYPYDKDVLKAFEGEENPFSFHNISKLLACQDNWRKDSRPQSVDISRLGENSLAVWMSLLMVDDEFSRAGSTQFTCKLLLSK